jgi:hypothetical protein
MGVAVLITVLALYPPARRRFPLMLGWLALPFVVWGLYLLLTGSLAAAYDGIVRFNAEVYSLYTPVGIKYWLPAMARNALSGLYIWKTSYWQLDTTAFGPAGHITATGRYLFGGFLFRLAVLLCVGLLLVRRRWLAAALIYGFALVTVTRAEAWFRLQPFALVSIVVTALVTGLWLERPPAARGKRWSKSRAWALRGASVLLVGLVAWPIVRGGLSLYQLRGQLAYRDNFSGQMTQAEHLLLLAGGREAALGVYPGDAILYFLTRLKPAGGLLFLWPWVAQEHQADLIEALADEPAVVYLIADGDIWGLPVAVYLADLRAYLEANYENPEPNYYLSPGLRAP